MKKLYFLFCLLLGDALQQRVRPDRERKVGG